MTQPLYVGRNNFELEKFFGTLTRLPQGKSIQSSFIDTQQVRGVDTFESQVVLLFKSDDSTILAGNTPGDYFKSQEITIRRDKKIQFYRQTARVFSFAAKLNSSRENASAAGATLDGMAFGGQSDPTTSEIFDGTTWTAAPAVIYTRKSGGTGRGSSSVLGISNGDVTSVQTVEFNGTAWSSGGNMNYGKNDCDMCGSWTDALVGTGTNSSPPFLGTEKYDGAVWNIESNRLYHRSLASQHGNSLDSIVSGGFDPSLVELKSTEAFDGTSWITENDALKTFNSARGNGFDGSIGWTTPIKEGSVNTSELLDFLGVVWVTGGNAPSVQGNSIGLYSFGSGLIGSGRNEEDKRMRDCYIWDIDQNDYTNPVPINIYVK